MKFIELTPIHTEYFNGRNMSPSINLSCSTRIYFPIDNFFSIERKIRWMTSDRKPYSYITFKKGLTILHNNKEHLIYEQYFAESPEQIFELIIAQSNEQPTQ